MHRFIRLSFTAAASGLAAFAVGAPSLASAAAPTAVYMKTVHASHHGGGGGSNNLSYRGGAVQTTGPTLYLTFWGSQWNNNDPSGEASTLQGFFKAESGSSWGRTDTQYCSGSTVPVGTTQCGSLGTDAANNTVVGGAWYDNGSAAPSSPSQSQLAAEAAKAAGHFNTVSPNAQFVVLTATGDNQTGFGTQWCAYHSTTSASGTTISWTYMPYITDAGGSCGADFNGLGGNAGITIVGGHEFAESATDPFPSSGWVDARGSEIGDKCAWISSGQGAAAAGPGGYPVQSLWSNAFNSGAGGCVLSYP